MGGRSIGSRAAVLLAAGLLAASSPMGAPAVGEPTADGYPSTGERAQLMLTNAARQDPQAWCVRCADDCSAYPATPMWPLSYDDRLGRAGRYHSQHMHDMPCFQHDSCCTLGWSGPDVVCVAGPSPAGCVACAGDTCAGTDPFTRMEDFFSYDANRGSGENIAAGAIYDAEGVTCGWLTSPGHRTNIYASVHVELGVGLFQGSACYDNYWSQEFGSAPTPLAPIPAASVVEGSTLWFGANWYDTSGLPPLDAQVVVDGACTPLALEWGSADNGTYSVTPPVAPGPGCHEYYFLFTDAAGNPVTYPTTGALVFGAGCAEYQTSRTTATCAPCADGQSESCYGGPAGTEGVGQCLAGTRDCVGGLWQGCVGEVLPALELCNGVDDDCDSQTDEEVQTWYLDFDADGFGDAGDAVVACSQPPGYVLDAGDCDDNDPTVQPGATETCDGVDEDCDGTTDEGVGTTWYRDLDGDGFGSTVWGIQRACVQPPGYVADRTDCNDNFDTVYPGAPDTCNGVDDDCDNLTDENATNTWYRDFDGDGFGSTQFGTADACDSPGGYVASSTDCDDNDASRNPGVAEVCDAVDQDCDGDTDEGVLLTFYFDGDSDGFGVDTATMTGCVRPGGWAEAGGDCAPLDDQVFPGAPEACNGVDDDCDGATDEGLLAVCDDGNPCNGFESCSAGACAAGTPVDCSSLDSTCTTGTCNPATGACEALPVANGTPCADGLPCNGDELCQGGTCAAGVPLDCSYLDGPCQTGVCVDLAGGCTAVVDPGCPTPDGGTPDAGTAPPDAGPGDAGSAPPDAGPGDAGSAPPDAGPGDAGSALPDAGPGDAGSAPPDAGPGDAGSALPDAGTATPDAGLRDAGTVPPDAGSALPDAGNAPPDAGSAPPDGGTAPPDGGATDTEPGCSCSPRSGSPAASAWTLLLVALFFRRRR